MFEDRPDRRGKKRGERREPRRSRQRRDEGSAGTPAQARLPDPPEHMGGPALEDEDSLVHDRPGRDIGDEIDLWI